MSDDFSDKWYETFDRIRRREYDRRARRSVVVFYVAMIAALLGWVGVAVWLYLWMGWVGVAILIAPYVVVLAVGSVLLYQETRFREGRH